MILKPDAPSAAPIKPVSPCRRTHGNVRNLEVDRSSFLSKNKLDIETVCDEAQVHNSVLEPNVITDGSSPDSIEKVLLDPASTSSTMEPSTTCPGVQFSHHASWSSCFLPHGYHVGTHTN
ncbi:hypothetical protein QQ045_014875 [Rhodiola kirilowii]